MISIKRVTGDKRTRGFSLVYFLLLMATVMILSAPLMRLLVHQKLQSYRVHWERCAESLADGALSMALVAIENGHRTAKLEADLSTGRAEIVLSPTEDKGVIQVAYRGVVSHTFKTLAVRAYQAEVVSASDGWKVASVRRSDWRGD